MILEGRNNMKRMVKWISLAMCAVLLGSSIVTFDVGQSLAADTKSVSGRETLNFNTGWLYSSENYANGEVVGLDESEFESVCVPHANKILDTHKRDDFPEAIASYRFISWYRRHFVLPQKYEGKRILVDFEGVATIADVYVNGKLVGTHEGAYTGFTVDITDAVYTDGRDNVLAVRVNSEKQAQIPPEGGVVDYCLFGGIVRDVTMTIANPVYVERTFTTTPDIENGNAIVHNAVDIISKENVNDNYTVEMKVIDKELKVAASVSKDFTVKGKGTQTVELETEAIADYHLWSSEDPYLYTVVTTVSQENTVLDTYSNTLGFRYFKFSEGPDDGSFYLNGKKTEIVGINRHEQWPWIGRAVPDKLQIQDADLIKSTGINVVRCSHYPQDPSFLNRCDEIGLLVFCEPPGWQHVGNDEWKETFKENLKELVLCDRNHPSIISWGPRPNESHPSLEFNRECEALCKELDPTRPTHGVRMEFDYPGEESGDNYFYNDNFEVVNDILTVNYRYPKDPYHIPYIVTEHSNDWYGGDGIPGASDAAAQNFINSFAEVLDYYFGNDKVAGGFGWSLFDYNNEVNYTNTGHVFYSGLYDIFRNEKPVAYVYKSQLSPEENGPIVYIANNWTKDTTSNIYVMSNCDEVELFVNGESKGKIKPNKYTNMPHPIYEFNNIDYEDGELTAVGYIDDVKVGECVRKTPGNATGLTAKADYDTLAADGTDMTSVAVAVVDEEGNTLPFASNKVNIRQISGVKTKLIAEENLAVEGGKAAFLVQSVYGKTGTATFEVSSPGLKSATVTINVDKYESDTLVPASAMNGTIKPALIDPVVMNDSQTRTDICTIKYEGKNWASGSEAGTYMEDNHWSNTTDESCNITFTGRSIKYYGSLAPGHGIAAFSLDGGDEIFVDCYAAERKNEVLLFDSGILSEGEHVLKVRVTGNKNELAWDSYVNVDKIEIARHKSKVDDSNIPACEHKTTEIRNAIPVSCASDGYSGDVYCITCNSLIASGVKTAKTKLHTWDHGVVSKEATANSAGEIVYTCTLCGETKTVQIPATGDNTNTSVATPTQTPNDTFVTNPTQNPPVNNDAVPVVGSMFKVSGAQYRVIKVNGQQYSVEYCGITGKIRKASIPAAVTVNGVTYKVTKIASGAFKNQNKMTSVTIGKNIETIGDNAFSGCSALKKIVIPASVKKIGKKAFYKCKKLKNIVIKSKKLTVKNIGNKAFKGIYAKASVKVPKKNKIAYRKLLIKKGAGKKLKIK